MISRRVLAQNIPELVPLPLHSLRQRPLLTSTQTRVDLRFGRRADDDAVVVAERRMMHKPPQSRVHQRNPLGITRGLNLLQAPQNLVGEVDVAKDLHLVEARPFGRARDVGQRLGQQAAGERRERIERDAQFLEQREQRLLRPAADRVIPALVHGGEDVSLADTDVVDGLDLGVRDVGHAEPLEPALAIQPVDRPALLLQTDRAVRPVEVVDVESVLLERGKRLPAVRHDVVFRERPRRERRRFRRDREPLVRPHRP